MSESTTIYRVEIPASDIADITTARGEFAKIYEELGRKPDEKAMALSGLASAIKLMDGSSLADRVLDEAIALTDEQQERSDMLRGALNATGAVPPETVPRVQHPDGDYLVVELSDDTEITNIFTRTVLPDEDERSIGSKRRQQARTPSGPKQNDSSGGINRVDPRSRH